MGRITLTVGLALLAMTGTSARGGDVPWQRAVYYDAAYPATWAAGAPLWVRDVLAQEGYTVLDAPALHAWMEARIADGLPSVLVFSQDVAPDTVVEVQTTECTLRRYLDAGGKVVWYADVPLYYQGHADGTLTTWGLDGSINILGLNAAGGTWDSGDEVTLTSDGESWGLTVTWPSERPTDPAGLRVLASNSAGQAAAWVKHYIGGDTYRGFVRFRDTPDAPNIDDLRRLAEFPNQVEPVLGENAKEAADDIVAAFLYPWYGNPQVSGEWIHWEADGHNPPLTWSANYLPNYPDAKWNPPVQLYDSSDIELLRWQDRAMARAGLDIIVASWWGIGLLEDEAFMRANYTCKSVKWCIYYELDVVGDPTPQQIYSDIKHVLDNSTPYRNYAQIDGKWLVMAYAVGDEDAANRWRQAKQLLAADGYHIYINANGQGSPLFAPDPWDALHHYNPIARHTLTESLIPVDDSHSISPGFWFYHEPPALTRTLLGYNFALNEIGANAARSRFIMVETWNEWHEGTSIEPGQRIVHDDLFGFLPTDDNYDFDYIDALAPAALAWQWTTPGHRPAAPPQRL
jgi:hypothetical protein